MNRNSIARKTVATTLLLASCVAPNSVHAGYVYWYENGIVGANAFMRMDLDGIGSAEVVYSYGGASTDLKGFDVDANYLYFGEGAIIKRVDLDGTNETTIINSSDVEGGIKGLAVDGGELYFVDADYFKKWDGTSVATLVTLPSGTNRSIALNSSSAFIGNDQAGSRDIIQYNKITGSTEVIYNPSLSYSLEYDSIDASETHVYTLSSILQEFEISGSSSTTLDSLTGPSGKNNALAYYEEGGNTYLYYTDRGGKKINLIKNGGTPTLIHTSTGFGGNASVKGLAVSSSNSGAPEPADTFAFLGLLTACCLGFRQWRQGRVSVKVTERS
jgi:hypothetical protein